MADPFFRLVHTPFAPLTDELGNSSSRIQPYPPMVNPCRVCPARCCTMTVKVSLPDVLRYCARLQVPFTAGFTLLPSIDEQLGFRVERDDRFVEPENGWPGFAELALRRVEGQCASLVDLGGHLRCGVYEARPTNCRLYPVSFEDEQGKDGPLSILCPAPFAVTPGVAGAVETVAKAARTEWRLHREVVASWNQRGTGASVREALQSLLGQAERHLDEDLPPNLFDGL